MTNKKKIVYQHPNDKFYMALTLSFLEHKSQMVDETSNYKSGYIFDRLITMIDYRSNGLRVRDDEVLPKYMGMHKKDFWKAFAVCVKYGLLTRKKFVDTSVIMINPAYVYRKKCLTEEHMLERAQLYKLYTEVREGVLSYEKSKFFVLFADKRQKDYENWVARQDDNMEAHLELLIRTTTKGTEEFNKRMRDMIEQEQLDKLIREYPESVRQVLEEERLNALKQKELFYDKER